MVTRLSEAERKALIERFQQRILAGIPLDQQWMREKVLQSAPRLPEEPTSEQLEAWLELTEIISDPVFAESLSSNAREVQARGLDLERLQRLNVEIGQAALQAQQRGVTPESAEGQALCERYLQGLAEVAGQRAEDPRFRAGVRQRFERQDPRATRYWQLVSILNGKAAMPNEVAGWSFVVQAVKHHLAAQAA